MLFPTLTFGLFFLVIFYASWSLREAPEIRIGLLVAASYVFYAFWDWRFAGLLALSTMLNWLAGEWVSRTDGKARQRVVQGLWPLTC